MLYILSELNNNLNFLKSIYLRISIGFVLSFLIVLILGKPFIKYLKKIKFGEEIRESGPASHYSKKGTPTMGGVLMIFGALLSSLIICDLKNKFVILLIITTLLFSAIGFIDDYKKFTVNKDGLAGRKKLLLQTIIAVIVWIFIKEFGITGNKIIDFSIINPLWSGSHIYIGSFLMLIFTILVINGTSNAVNITDGLDGLATMPVIISCSILTTIAYFSSHFELSSHLRLFYIVGAGEIAVFLSTIIGAGLAFLWYNCYPAQIFMGDTGSLTLGGIIGVIGIILKQELLIPIIGGVFVMEAVSVMLQVGSYKLRKKRIFRMAPIHHHFELMGIPESKVTFRLWIMALICGGIALSIVRLRGIL
ncbi:phospho-N-acetylmuramoyl-pentapeptide-transferase [Fusobacterium perfoetens]|uniref:phospho-N-acetylmuramoyl-pentapeptide- transferase n=1 Tax=Fusobacterium perfoetens TaxID=852 RepID=UPI00048072B2|nr:phospho-N-acetylmuramoyl-pentapeptide-transferase [Fusobacterium perfoetens]MCI6153017.1 phospho-N-acetylmuramoyl-pentapeptide-transferase [Fusobacterium perfoetens]MDY3237414.1 phospho-N-acetylmuramoyl-pentapeptide-transferase [Fusobacterium perfoetens]